jgi:uncharacterized short protein YbdD (DUF466 family)
VLSLIREVHLPEPCQCLYIIKEDLTMASHPINQFYAELNDYKPKIWRRFQIMDDITVARLGYILQVLFEMKASHLMAIEVPKGENFAKYMKAMHPDLPKASTNEYYNNLICRYEIIG